MAVVDNGDYLFYMVIDYVPKSEWYNIVFAIVLAIIFVIGLYFGNEYFPPDGADHFVGVAAV